MPPSLKIGFLGAGKMATALAKGFLQAGLVEANHVMASDLSEEACSAFAQATTARTTGFNLDVVTFANVLIVAVKPDQVPSLLAEIGPRITSEHLLLSIAAGVPLSKLEGSLEEGTRVIRVMPNTPALIGASATAFSPGAAATQADQQLAQQLFSAVGIAFPLKESLLDAVTGLSGSGPAYVYLVIEAMSDGGVAAGLPREIATRLAAQTVLGAARMVIETGKHPGVLKDMVASPGGTTIDGLHELEKGQLRGALISAVRVAAEKSRKLAQS